MQSVRILGRDQDHPVGKPRDRRHPDAQPLELADAYAELQNLILDQRDVTEFLQELAMLAAAIVPGSHCGVTLRRGSQVASVAHSDEIALRMDELQYLGGLGPCLHALEYDERVDVPDTTTETRWGGYASYALANGIQSSFSLPLRLDGATRGAVNLFSPRIGAFSETDIQRAQAFTLNTRAVIDQALGILMGARKINSRQAFEHLRQASQSSNRRLSEIAAELITTMTGHPPRNHHAPSHTATNAIRNSARSGRLIRVGGCRSGCLILVLTAR